MEGPITKSIINVQYNIPRFVIASPGRQNRTCTGEMRIVPGVANPLEFQYVNADGVVINLNGFTLRLVFWFPQNQYELLASNRQGNILLAKDCCVDDPYTGKATTLLTDQETLTLARNGRASLRWSVYLIDSISSNVFAAQITSKGEPWGTAYFTQSDIPNADMIKGITVSRGEDTPPFFFTVNGVMAVSQVGSFVVNPSTDTVFLGGLMVVGQIGKPMTNPHFDAISVNGAMVTAQNGVLVTSPHVITGFIGEVSAVAQHGSLISTCFIPLEGVEATSQYGTLVVEE